MTNFNSTHKFTAAAAFGAAALFSMLSFGSNAEAARVSQLPGRLCQEQPCPVARRVVEEKGRPLWMIQARRKLP